MKFVWLEAKERNYNFDKTKFKEIVNVEKINVTVGQINFERKHLLKKLKLRDEKKYYEIVDFTNFEIHPLFYIIKGEIEPWEKV